MKITSYFAIAATVATSPSWDVIANERLPQNIGFCRFSDKASHFLDTVSDVSPQECHKLCMDRADCDLYAFASNPNPWSSLCLLYKDVHNTHDKHKNDMVHTLIEMSYTDVWCHKVLRNGCGTHIDGQCYDGGDIRYYVNSTTPADCEVKCNRHDPKCTRWTWVEDCYYGSSGCCWVKTNKATGLRPVRAPYGTRCVSSFKCQAHVATNATCTLADGETVSVGWSGENTGVEYCNTCTCNATASGTVQTAPELICPKKKLCSMQCTLHGGEVVKNNWRGKNTGKEYCNTCRCKDGRLNCYTNKKCTLQCTLEGGEVVDHQWRGKNTGKEYCNSCTCANGHLDCYNVRTCQLNCQLNGGEIVNSGWRGQNTGREYCKLCTCTEYGELDCPHQPEFPNGCPTQCTLANGAVVEHGWAGNNTGIKYCHSCRCHYGLLGCENPRKLCHSQCRLEAGDVVYGGWEGYNTGKEYCNKCTCRSWQLECPNKKECPVKCTLAGGEIVADGWSGSNTGKEYCRADCSCTMGQLTCIDDATANYNGTNMLQNQGCPFECTLAAGEVVSSGWIGNNTGKEYCRRCTCYRGHLACGIVPADTRKICPSECTFPSGEVVNDGWSGYHTQPNEYCNRCTCTYGKLECSNDECPVRCQLAAGEYVKQGWKGNNTGSEHCNVCKCIAVDISLPSAPSTNNGKMVGRLYCPHKKSRCPARCQLAEGEIVPENWHGYNTGSEYCNVCECTTAGELDCSSGVGNQSPCPARCQLAGGEMVRALWQGNNTSSHYCYTCNCTEDGELECSTTTTVDEDGKCPPRCQLDGGEFVMPGWHGSNTGKEYCRVNCTCTAAGKLLCASSYVTEENTTTTTTPSSSNITENATQCVPRCILQGGEVVKNGWHGRNTGSDYCHTCTCTNWTLNCAHAHAQKGTRQTNCPERLPGQCVLWDGTLVDQSFRGYDNGDNYCHSCVCHESGELQCTQGETPCTPQISLPEADPASTACTLTGGGNPVQDGWQGKDTGNNYCNVCECIRGHLHCTTHMRCVTPRPAKKPNDCELIDGSVVREGYLGHDKGVEYCNTCACRYGKLNCSHRKCPKPLLSMKGTHGNSSCILSDGQTVQHGFDGYDTEYNYCNRCKCENSELHCTEHACASRHHFPLRAIGMCADVPDGTLLPRTISGSDRGPLCNVCECAGGTVICTVKLCLGRRSENDSGETTRDCTFPDGATVRDGWRGTDICNECECYNGYLDCKITTLCGGSGELGYGAPSSSADVGDETGTHANSQMHMTNRNCTLSDHRRVADGWLGEDSGSNACNTCWCRNGNLACTGDTCSSPKSQLLSLRLRRSANDQCKMPKSGKLVAHGWFGRAEGTNSCNRCWCFQGNLSCTSRNCARRKRLSDWLR